MQLFAPADLDQLQPDLAYFTEMTEWVKNFLGRPHPDLGRSGPVCPFVPRALQLDTIRLAVIRTQAMGQSQIEEIVRRYRDQFLELEPQSGEMAFYKAIMLVFPDVSPEQAPELIDAVQQKLKPFFVEQGLMIGEFHQQNETPGLHNPHFRPLRSPIPMLAIRFMAESDLPFLERMSDQPQLRVRYLQAYLERMSSIIKDEAKLSHARKALALAQAQLAQGHPVTIPQDYLAAPKVSKCPFARLARAFG
ncbi:MAG: hypothetical protein KME45_04000 [Stenomitos rutilans HA7619-LM2]|jgi:hypothetical protein|nr:hypothetical protein [Stenomitos rutilans HA7619-LM2]